MVYVCAHARTHTHTHTHTQYDYDHYSELFDDLKWLKGKNQLGKDPKKTSGDSSNAHAQKKKAESGSPDQDDLMFPAGLASFGADVGDDEVDFDEESAEMHKLKVCIYMHIAGLEKLL